jgi:hypothetical protein
VLSRESAANSPEGLESRALRSALATKESITFGAWRKRHDVTDRAVYLVLVTNHAIMVQANMASGIGLMLGPLREATTTYDRRRVGGIFRIKPATVDLRRRLQTLRRALFRETARVLYFRWWALSNH